MDSSEVLPEKSCFRGIEAIHPNSAGKPEFVDLFMRELAESGEENNYGGRKSNHQ